MRTDLLLSLLRLLRRAEGLVAPDASAHLEAFGPGLSIGSPARVVAPSLAQLEPARAVASEGFAPLPRAAPQDACARLVACIERLTAAGLPATFVYLFDQPWHWGEALCARVSTQLGQRYELVEDVWAWRIPAGLSGWPPHRGVATPLLDRHAPELLNTWLALSDVEADRACMHFVPLDRDPAYPHDLATLTAPASAAIAAPLAAGDALVWNANTLHWGGACAEGARGARVSCSFSLARAGTLAEHPRVRDSLDLRARLYAVARQIVVYGQGQPDVGPEVMEWARGTVAVALFQRNK